MLVMLINKTSNHSSSSLMPVLLLTKLRLLLLFMLPFSPRNYFTSDLHNQPLPLPLPLLSARTAVVTVSFPHEGSCLVPACRMEEVFARSGTNTHSISWGFPKIGDPNIAP